MAETTAIQWCDATFNPWRGCTKVSPGCAHCYAETLSYRNPAVLGGWGPGAPRVEAAESYWRLPGRWYKAARKDRRRLRVFCASLADVFDAEAPFAAQARLWQTIVGTSGYTHGDFAGGGLDWLLLTKRPERIGEVVRAHGLRPSFFRDNRCWLGVSVESQKYLERYWTVRHWSGTPWISAEPLLGPLEMPNVLSQGEDGGGCRWIVAGGESDGRRPCNLEWVRSIIAQCRHHGVACFVKQLGSAPVVYGPPDGYMAQDQRKLIPLTLADRRKGGEPSEWPPDLRVREWPATAA